MSGGAGLAIASPPPRPAAGRPDKRRDRSRAALLHTAGLMLARMPLSELSVDALVAAADVAKATFYNHFVDKEQLAGALIETLRLELRQVFLAEIAGLDDPARRIARGFCVAIRFRHREPGRTMLLARSMVLAAAVDDPLNAGIVNEVTQGLAQGRFRLQTVASGVVFTLALLQACFMRQGEAADGFGTAASAGQLTALVLRGLGLDHDEAELIATRESNEIL